MPTFLFSETIFGPIKSRRFGISLGINLLPCDRKVCSFNCIYCECGWTAKENFSPGSGLADPFETMESLKNKLALMSANHEFPDSITFAGNGEPTLHPEFLSMMKKTIALRDHYAPKARITVLSNASTVHRADVFEALMLAEDHVMKLDAGTENTFRLINQATDNLSFSRILSNLMLFDGDLTIQTLFLKGVYKNQQVDNTTPAEIEAWIHHLDRIRPRLVMLYSIARDTPANPLEKTTPPQLAQIAHQVNQLGIATEVFS